MKKMFGVLSWILAIVGTLAIVLTTTPTPIIDSFAVFWVGIFVVIVGIVGILLTCKKSREWIWMLLDLI